MDESISDTSETYHPFYRVEFYGAKRIFPNSHEFLIGRGGLSNLRVDSNTVSRQHCAIKWTEDGWKVINKSVNGTSINGFITTNPYPRDLTNSDIIVIGDVFLQCFLEVNNDLYRLPVRILRIVVLVGFDNCSLLPEDLEEPQIERLIALITAEIGKEEKLKIERKMINAKTNSQESLMMESEGNKESALEKFNFLIKNNLMLSKELEESNKAYRKALSEKEDAMLKLNQIRQDVSTSLEGLVETELKCSICYEIVINATTTNCSHTFCELCFLKWTKKNNVCPVCRASISSHVRTKMIDNYVEKLIMNFPEEFQQKRKEMVDSRNELTNTLKETRPAKKRKRTVTAAARNGRRAITITLQNLASLMDTTIDISSDDESPVVLFEQSLQP